MLPFIGRSWKWRSRDHTLLLRMAKGWVKVTAQARTICVRRAPLSRLAEETALQFVSAFQRELSKDATRERTTQFSEVCFYAAAGSAGAASPRACRATAAA